MMNRSFYFERSGLSALRPKAGLLFMIPYESPDDDNDCAGDEDIVRIRLYLSHTECGSYPQDNKADD
jgi:hypothetical protein